MKSNCRNILLVFSVILLLIVSSTTCFLAGIYYENSNQEVTETPSSKLVERAVYYNTEERYVDSDSEIFSDLLSDAYKHFTFSFLVNNKDEYQLDRDFLLVNLENQYDRLSVKFNKDLSEPVLIVLTDSTATFAEELGTGVEIDAVGTEQSAFTLGNEKIVVLINPLRTPDKYDVAHTLSHELNHLFQYLINGENMLYIPNWYLEGFSETMAYPTEYSLIHSEIKTVVPDLNTLELYLESLSSHEYTIGYDMAEAFFTYMINAYGEDQVLKVFRQTSGNNFEETFTAVLGKDSDTVYDEWLTD